MTIAQNIDSFMYKIYNNSNYRYTSWEICFKVFGNDNLDNKVKALYLAGLSSWEMYRGNSMLLSKYNYKIFKDLAPIIKIYKFKKRVFRRE